MSSDPKDHPPKDFMFAARARCHVYRLPAKLTNGYCFDGGHPISFHNVDWFDAPIAQGRDTVIAFIKKKAYFNPAARFLVLSDHPDLTFTIEPPTRFTEETCPGHVASESDAKVCGRCGVHIDSFRPDDEQGGAP